MPFYLIQARGLSPDRAGLILSAQPLMMAIAAPLAGTLSDRIGSRLLSSLGMMVLGAMLVVLSGIVQDTSLNVIVLYLAVIGVGIGVFISPNSNALMGSAPRHRQGVAAGVLATARNVGMVLGVGLSSAVSTSVETAARAAGRPDAFIQGLHVTFLALAGVAALGVVTSLTRGRGQPCEDLPPSQG
jgi:MFS family permease